MIIFDTTLRDGEQSPGCRMDADSKLLIARQLAKLGVDVIEAGFPVSSPGDLEAVSKISQEIEGPTICALARTRTLDVETAGDAIKKAKKQRIHVFIATSDIHMENKLRKSPQKVMEMAAQAIQCAGCYTNDIEFSPEDASRSGLDFLMEIISMAIEGGATTINIPDTVGYSVGEEYYVLMQKVCNLVAAHPDVVVSTHCHNDLNLAVANTLAGIRAGARQAECCVLGIGERAGNAQLEAVVMALKTRHDYFGNLQMGIDTRELGNTARLVASVIGKPIADNLPIIGGSVFAHSAGIHADGVIKDRRTYEIMKPEDVGWKGEPSPLTKHSGRGALQHRLKNLGYQLDDATLEKVFVRFKSLADQKTYIHNDDIHMLMQEVMIAQRASSENLFIVEDVDYHRIAGKIKVNVVLKRNGSEFEASGRGDGPASAVGDAINKILRQHKIVNSDLVLKDFNIGKGPGGLEAMGLATLRVENEGKAGYGRGSDTDIILACAKALVSAVNHLLEAPVKKATE